MQTSWKVFFKFSSSFFTAFLILVRFYNYPGDSMVRSKILAIAVALIVALSLASIVTLTKPFNPDEKTAQILIENAEKLRSLIGKKLDIVNYVLLNLSLSESEAVKVNFTLELIVNHTSQGDVYLNISKTLYAEGNFTEAKFYAIKAIQSYHKALELIHDLVLTLDIDLENCCVKEQLKNQTKIGIKNNSLIMAFIVAENHVERLRTIIENMNKTDLDYDFSSILSELAEIEELIEEGKTLAEAGNASDAAKILALVKMKLGHLTAEIHKIGTLVAIKKIKVYFYHQFGKENKAELELILANVTLKLNKGELKSLMKDLKKTYHEMMKLKEKHKGGNFTPPGHSKGEEKSGHGHGH